MPRRKKKPPIRVHRLVGLFQGEGEQIETAGYHVNMLGQLGDHVIVSVPVDMSGSTIRRIHQTLTGELGKPVLVISHNIEFLATEELPRKEAAEYLLQLADRSGNGDGKEEGHGGAAEAGREEASEEDAGPGDAEGADPRPAGELGPESGDPSSGD